MAIFEKKISWLKKVLQKCFTVLKKRYGREAVFCPPAIRIPYPKLDLGNPPSILMRMEEDIKERQKKRKVLTNAH